MHFEELLYKCRISFLNYATTTYKKFRASRHCMSEIHACKKIISVTSLTVIKTIQNRFGFEEPGVNLLEEMKLMRISLQK